MGAAAVYISAGCLEEAGVESAGQLDAHDTRTTMRLNSRKY
jgi:hypothetical protein